jgi:hypothetical protein
MATNCIVYVKILKPMIVWTGHYERVIGNKSAAFSIKFIDGKWWPVVVYESNKNERVECLADDCKASYELAKVVNSAKYRMTQTNGGAFVINEFGQIIVPNSQGNGVRMYVGVLKGELRFKDPLTNNFFSFNDDSGLKTGDLWNKPYVGVMYHLSQRHKIYGKINEISDEYKIIEPPIHDENLIKAIKKIRGSNGARFIVNHHGIVLTKKEFAYKDWRPVYVGRIDYNKWFKKNE